LVRCSATTDASPNNPRQLRSTASTAKTETSLPTRSSATNFNAYSWSANLYSKGAEGIIFLKTASILGSTSAILEFGLMRMLTQLVPYLPRKKTVGTGGAYGDLITISLMT